MRPADAFTFKPAAEKIKIMPEKQTLTHRQLNTFLYRPEIRGLPIRRQIEAAKAHFSPEEMSEAHRAVSFHAEDIYSVTDEEFAELCEMIPIGLDDVVLFDETITLDDVLCIPDGATRCAFFRHINALNVKEHYHTFFEFCFIWKGGLIQNSNGKEYAIEEGEFIITPPGVGHTVRPKTPESIIFNILIPLEMFRTILFDSMAVSHPLAKFLRQCVFGTGAEEPYLYKEESTKEKFKNVFKSLIYEYYGADRNPMIITGFLNHFLGIAMAGSLKRDEDAAFAILEYINNNYQTVTLSALSEKFGYNEAYLSRLIKEETGRTFSQLLRHIRVIYAENLLMRNETSVQEAGEIVGYSDYAGFARAFVKEKGIKPAQYRKEKRGEDSAEPEI